MISFFFLAWPRYVEDMEEYVSLLLNYVSVFELLLTLSVSSQLSRRDFYFLLQFVVLEIIFFHLHYTYFILHYSLNFVFLYLKVHLAEGIFLTLSHFKFTSQSFLKLLKLKSMKYHEFDYKKIMEDDTIKETGIDGMGL